MSLLKISDVVIACDLWFGPLPIKNPGYTCGYYGYVPPVAVTSDVICRCYSILFFGLELVLIMIRVGAKFRL